MSHREESRSRTTSALAWAPTAGWCSGGRRTACYARATWTIDCDPQQTAAGDPRCRTCSIFRSALARPYTFTDTPSIACVSVPSLSSGAVKRTMRMPAPLRDTTQVPAPPDETGDGPVNRGAAHRLTSQNLRLTHGGSWSTALASHLSPRFRLRASFVLTSRKLIVTREARP